MTTAIEQLDICDLATFDDLTRIYQAAIDVSEQKSLDGWKAKLAKCSPDTALRDIRELLARGVLVQNEGGGRSTSYHLLY